MLAAQDVMIRLNPLPFLLLLAGCNVFKAQLYIDRMEGGVDAEPMTPTPDGGRPLVLAERCESVGSIPLLGAGGEPYAVDTRTMSSDYRELSACVGHELLGNDGFIAVDMKAGEKWHVHINPLTPDYDPAVYILASCDERACGTTTAIDECGPGKSEHLSFIPSQTSRYLVGIDSPTAGGGQATVVIAQPKCGNGTTEHSETCDDGNTNSGDGCDSLCRRELPATTSEMEPNDDLRAANILIMSRMATVRVSGMLATRCDHDMFSVTVAAAGSVRARVSGTGTPCTAEAIPVRLALVASDGQTEIGVGSAAAGDDCPAIDDRHPFAKNLPAGEYYLMVKRPSNTPLPYQLTVEGP
jgi:cysteine-rich repeat protein